MFSLLYFHHLHDALMFICPFICLTSCHRTGTVSPPLPGSSFVDPSISLTLHLCRVLLCVCLSGCLYIQYIYSLEWPTIFLFSLQLLPLYLLFCWPCSLRFVDHCPSTRSCRYYLFSHLKCLRYVFIAQSDPIWPVCVCNVVCLHGGRFHVICCCKLTMFHQRIWDQRHTNIRSRDTSTETAKLVAGQWTTAL